jgi:hydrogenase-4 component F
MIFIYCAVALVSLVLLLFSGSHKLMTFISIFQSAVSMVLSVYFLLSASLPVYYLSNSYLFMDRFSLYETIITWLVFLLASVYAEGYMGHLLETSGFHRRNLKMFYMAFNLLPVTIMFAFFSNNLALFWVFVELTTIISAVLIVLPNAKENIIVALNYIFIASTAMLFSFIGLILLFGLSKHSTGTGTLNWDSLLGIAPSLPPPILTLSLIFIFIGFATKSGIAPFHTWLPHAHAKAPSVVSALLSAVLLNVGMYGIIRIYALAKHTPAVTIITVIFFLFGFITILIAAITMFSQKDLKKFIAYSSVENMGMILIGIGIGTPLALFWVLFHTLAHSLAKALHFFSAGVMQHQYENVLIYEMGGALTLQPFPSFCLILGSLTAIGAPLLPIFLSKLGILMELAKVSKVLLFLSIVLFFFVASAFSVVLINLFLRKSKQGRSLPVRVAVPVTTTIPLVILIILIVMLGVYMPKELSGLLASITSELGI